MNKRRFRPGVLLGGIIGTGAATVVSIYRHGFDGAEIAVGMFAGVVMLSFLILVSSE